MPTALVTGATGFIGRHLTARLVTDGWRVVSLQRSATAHAPASSALAGMGVQVEVFTSSDDVQRLAREVQPDVVFHLATHFLKDHAPDDVERLIDANIAFGAHLLEGLRGSGAIVVSAMSYFQYSQGAPTPVSLYSATKQAFLEICEYYRVVCGLDVRQVVLFDTFGPGDTRNKLVPLLLQALRNGSTVHLGPSRQPINLLYVEDVVSGLLAASGPQQGHMFRIAAPQAVTVGALVSAFSDAAGTTLRCDFNEEGTVNNAPLNAGSWPEPGGWAGSRPLQEGLELTWRSTSSD